MFVFGPTLVSDRTPDLQRRIPVLGYWHQAIINYKGSDFMLCTDTPLVSVIPMAEHFPTWQTLRQRSVASCHEFRSSFETSGCWIVKMRQNLRNIRARLNIQYVKDVAKASH